MIWGAIFDFDGVIVNSENAHRKCWFEIAKKLNLPITDEQFLSGFGVKNALFISKILQWTDDKEKIEKIIYDKEKLFQELVAKEGITFIPGTVKLIEELKRAKIPCAIGSSSIYKNIEIVLKLFPIKDAFQAIISGEKVHHGKPDPEVFLLAASALKISPEKCVVFEDAPYGIEAGKRARMKTVALTTTFPEKAFSVEPYVPNFILDSLHELDVEKLASWFH